MRKLNSQTGVLATLAGSALVGDEGDGSPANAAALTTPTGVAVDSLGRVWVPVKTIPVLRLGLLLLGLGSILGCANLAPPPPPPISDEITVLASTPTQGVMASAQLLVNMAQ